MKRRNSNILSYLLLVILVALVVGVIYIFQSSAFEKNKPVVIADETIYWNLREPLNLKIVDDTGIKYYKVTYIDGNNDKVLATQVLSNPQKEIELKLEAPKVGMFHKGEDVKIIIEATDISKWNFFNGNTLVQELNISVDTQRPIANVIANTYAITRGGSGVVVVEVKDDNLLDMYITFNDTTRYELTPFYKKNFYVALIAWPMEQENFIGVSLVAKDKANNTTTTKVPLYIRNYNYKTEDLNVDDKFIESVSTEVLLNSNKAIDENLVARFLRSNLELRAENLAKIRKVSIGGMDTQMVDSFEVIPFRRLANSKTVAGYGDRRNYFYKGQQIDTQWHLGVDWASVKNAPIYTTNGGKVIFQDYLGIYGNTIIIEHGLGLATLYAHASNFAVNNGDFVKPNAHIANTGTTGAVFGDHLHFGVLVQGIEVNPLEWMDRDWIRTRITDILTTSKKVIDTK